MLAKLDVFHEGERLVPTSQFLKGNLPWRELTPIHGWMQDVFVALPGMGLIERSRWGAVAGELLWVTPAAFVCTYVVVMQLVRRRAIAFAMLLAGIYLLNAGMFGGEFWSINDRLIPFWLFLAVLAATFHRPTRPRLVLIGFLAVVAMVLTPETSVTVVPALAVLLLRTLWDRTSRQHIVRVVVAPAVGVLVAGGILWAYLAATDSVSGFVDWYRTVIGPQGLYSVIPPSWTTLELWVVAVTSAAIPLFVVVQVGLRMRSRRPITAAQWTALALALGTLCYYPKFLTRADGHAFHVWAVCLPLAFVRGRPRPGASPRSAVRAPNASAGHPPRHRGDGRRRRDRISGALRSRQVVADEPVSADIRHDSCSGRS